MTKRLVLAALGLALAPTLALAAGWKIETARSALDGRNTGSAILASETRTPNTIGAQETAALVLRCQDDKIEAYVAWPGFIGLRTARGAYRIDSGPMIANEGFRLSTSGDSTFFIRPQNIFFAMRGGPSKLVIRVEPTGYPTQEAVFDLSGASDAVTQIGRACAGLGPAYSTPPAPR